MEKLRCSRAQRTAPSYLQSISIESNKIPTVESGLALEVEAVVAAIAAVVPPAEEEDVAAADDDDDEEDDDDDDGGAGCGGEACSRSMNGNECREIESAGGSCDVCNVTVSLLFLPSSLFHDETADFLNSVLDEDIADVPDEDNVDPAWFFWQCLNREHKKSNS